LSGSSKEDIYARYGYSRVMGHLYETAWDKQRWDGLKDKKKGPKSRSRRTEKLERRVLTIRFKNPEKDMYEITDILLEEGYIISARSVARVLSEHGVALKKTKRKT
jgi:transposase